MELRGIEIVREMVKIPYAMFMVYDLEGSKFLCFVNSFIYIPDDPPKRDNIESNRQRLISKRRV